MVLIRAGELEKFLKNNKRRGGGERILLGTREKEHYFILLCLKRYSLNQWSKSKKKKKKGKKVYLKSLRSHGNLQIKLSGIGLDV